MCLGVAVRKNNSIIAFYSALSVIGRAFLFSVILRNEVPAVATMQINFWFVIVLILFIVNDKEN